MKALEIAKRALKDVLEYNNEYDVTRMPIVNCCEKALAEIEVAEKEVVEDERKAFEAAFELQYNGTAIFERDENDCYVEFHANFAWNFWKARAALSQAKPVVPDDFVKKLQHIAGGLENQIANAEIRKDTYDVGYLTGMLEEVEAMLPSDPEAGEQDV